MKKVGPEGIGFKRMVERIYNDGLNVIVFSIINETFIVPLSEDDSDNDLFVYDSTNMTIKTKQSGLKNLSLFANVNEGGGSADIVFLVESSSLPTSGFVPASFALMKEYNVDGGSMQIATTINMDKDLYYRVVAFNSDGGNVTYTTDTYTINGNVIIAPAFLATITT